MKRAAVLVFGIELKGLLRDRRALFSALLLPFLLYPLMMVGHSEFEKMSREGMEEREVHLVLDLAQAPVELSSRLQALLLAEGPARLTEIEGDVGADWSEESHSVRRRVADLLGEDGHLLVRAAPHEEEASRTVFHLYHDGASDIANEAAARAWRASNKLVRLTALERRETLLSSDPALGLDLEAVDVANDADKSSAAIGRLLPLLLVFSILAGGSIAALAAFCGERENGTLETLLVQPVSSLAVARGKFAAVCVAALATLLANALSLLMCVALGLEGDLLPSGTLNPARLALGAVVFLPALVLLCAVLAFVSGHAKSFREGQHYIVPLNLVAMLPAAIAMMPDVALDPLLAAVPITGPALALRDALSGNLRLGLGLWMFIANTLWAHLVLRRLARILDAERIFQSADTSREQEARNTRSRAARRWAFTTILLVYVVGGTLQAENLILGLLVTLWVLIPAMTFFSARAHAREAGWREALGLRLPSLQHALGAVLVAPALGWLTSIAIEWQARVLPMPSSVARSMEHLDGIAEFHPALVIFLLAISPGICEELFFRGANLAALKRDLSPGRVILWQALLFGLVHASIYRFLPTAVLGALLAALTLRTRSVIPAILMHTVYSTAILLQPWHDAPDGPLRLDLDPTLMGPAMILGAAVGLVLLSRKR